MSFSRDIKEELEEVYSEARHCQIAELAAVLSLCGSIIINSRNEYRLKIHTENKSVARKAFTLIEKTFNIKGDVSIRNNIKKQNVIYSVVIRESSQALRILQATKLLEAQESHLDEVHIVNPIIIQQMCCRRSFLRGAFLAAGSISDPTKSYHLELVCIAEEMAEEIRRLLRSFGVDAKIVIRKKMYVVYLKEGAQIVDVLNIIEAHKGLMQLENIRILKEMRNTVNRKVNCETANINKTVSAAVKQMEDITYLRDTLGLENLPFALQDIAMARLEHPEASLKELGTYLTPQVGKSGVNHRLRKLGEMAEKVKQDQGGTI